jgi:hypothetical protein
VFVQTANKRQKRIDFVFIKDNFNYEEESELSKIRRPEAGVKCVHAQKRGNL